jgi:hypothetical protein
LRKKLHPLLTKKSLRKVEKISMVVEKPNRLFTEIPFSPEKSPLVYGLCSVN